MADNPKLEAMTLRGVPAPAPADYCDEISDLQWQAICDATKDYQDTDGSEIIAGEPW